MENRNIANILNVIAQLLSLSDRPTARFEVRAYQKAALTIETLQEPIEDIYKKGGIKALLELPGVGKSIAGHIEEYIKTGKIKKYEELKKKYPLDMASLTSIQGLGAKRAVILYQKLGIKNVEDLKKALEQHKIAKLEGFGEKSEEALQKGLAFASSGGGRVLISTALPVAENLVSKLQNSGLVLRAMVAGSARRMRETVGDLDLLVISKKNEDVMDFFTKLPDVDSIIVKGPTKTSVMLKMGLQVDLRVLPEESFGASVLYFTGSKNFNIKVRTVAIKKGYKLNEYGLLDKHGKNVGGPDEESIFKKLNLQYIEPEAREDRGELALMEKFEFPTLVQLSDIKGDLHTHSNELPGTTLEKMARAAMAMKYEYINNSDHTKSLVVEKGLNDAGFQKIFRNIDKLNDGLEKEGKKFRVLKGAECDILKDGSLDLMDKTLKEMDCVVASVHSNTRSMSESEMTKRIVKALDTGLVHVLGHPTGRIINQRPPYPVSLESVAEAAERNKVALEINSTARMDLNDTNILLTSKYKVLYSIATDSHRMQELTLMRYGVGTARRAWLTPNRVLNAMKLPRLLKWLER